MLILSQINTIFVTKLHEFMILKNDIEQRIISSKKGTILFPSDFVLSGNNDAIRQKLSRLVREKKLERLAHGIYLKPEMDAEIGIIYPSVEQIAREIARRDNIRIAPTGVHALHLLGLSNQIPLKAIYMTNGTPRTLKIGKRTIEFQRKSTKIMDIKSDLLLLIVVALQELGKDNISLEIKVKLREIITKETKKDIFLKELHKVPVWISTLIMDILA
jgi:Family of unknown function (DUF6088)